MHEWPEHPLFTTEWALEYGWSADQAPGFAAFMRHVDAEVFEICGLSLHDLPDYDYACAYEDGESAYDTAVMALSAAGCEI